MLTTSTGDDKDYYHSRPTVLPDGSSVLFTRHALDRANDVAVIRDRTGRESVFPGYAHAAYSSGFLVFPRGDQLYAQRLDLATNALLGDARSLAIPVFRQGLDEFGFAVGGTTLVSLTGVLRSRSQFAYFDRRGTRLGTIGPEGDYGAFDITARGDQ